MAPRGLVAAVQVAQVAPERLDAPAVVAHELLLLRQAVVVLQLEHAQPPQPEQAPRQRPALSAGQSRVVELALEEARAKAAEVGSSEEGADSQSQSCSAAQNEQLL